MSKPLHEMTREEYFNDPDLVREHATAAGVKGEPYEHAHTKKGRIYKVSTKHKPLNNMDLFTYGKEAHRNAVESALKEGKAVPSHVLADYPHLQHKQSQHSEQAMPANKFAPPYASAYSEVFGAVPPLVDESEQFGETVNGRITVFPHHTDSQHSEEADKEQHYHGLADWVKDYNKVRKSGNVKLAKSIRNNIYAKIKQHKLDEKRVFNTDPDAESDVARYGPVVQHSEETDDQPDINLPGFVAMPGLRPEPPIQFAEGDDDENYIHLHVLPTFSPKGKFLVASRHTGGVMNVKGKINDEHPAKHFDSEEEAHKWVSSLPKGLRQYKIHQHSEEQFAEKVVSGRSGILAPGWNKGKYDKKFHNLLKQHGGTTHTAHGHFTMPASKVAAFHAAAEKLGYQNKYHYSIQE